VQTESHPYYSLTIFFVTIRRSHYRKLGKGGQFKEQLSSDRLRVVEYLAIESSRAVVRVRQPKGGGGLMGTVGTSL
jgi:hypothetical protein